MERFYRKRCRADDLVFFRAVIEQTDLYIGADRILLREAEESIRRVRAILEGYIKKHPEFLHSLEPVLPHSDAPELIRHMCEAAGKSGVGPMAGVAGAIADHVGNDLGILSKEIIVENGGDIYIRTGRERKIGIYAGASPMSGKLVIKLNPEQTPCGVCTSSGRIGHSLSFGCADAAVVVSEDVILADAVATAAGNGVKCPEDLGKTINIIKKIPGVCGAVLILDDKLAAWGNIELSTI